MDKKQPEAQERKFWERLCALNRFSFFYMGGGVARASDKSGNWIEVHSAQEIVDDAECEVSTQHARITELESQLAQRFDAADMATAAAQGFLDGATAPAQPVAAPAAQPGVVYAELPVPNYPKSGGFPGTFAEAQMRAFADATHALRASHGQAPADAKALAEADRRAGEAERLLATCKEDVMRFEQVRSRMKYQWGAEQRVSFDEVWDEALALKKAAQAAPQAADSVTAPAPPPECETEAEKRAFAFGWFKALESERMKADNKKKDPL